MSSDIINEESQIILCSAITGSGVNVAPVLNDPGEWVVYLWAKTADLPTDFKSRIRSMAFHKSIQTPDVKYEDGFRCKAKMRSKDAARAKIKLVQAFVAREKYYLMVNNWTGSAYARWPFFNGSSTLVYYCRGTLAHFRPKMQKGHTWEISIDFKEVWL